MIKLLITSVGSLVGQNILDVLEYEGFRRRGLVYIVGTNSLANSVNNFRCDRIYLVPNTNSTEFTSEISDIIESEQPDIFLPGRDVDTAVLSKLIEEKDWSLKHPFGKAQTLVIALNKWETWKFCRRNDLPFAASFVFGVSGQEQELREFIEQYGYPLIAKPMEGFASKGVLFVTCWDDVENIREFEGYMFQEYLGSAGQLEDYFSTMRMGIPLFNHAPNIYHYSCHTIILPNGTHDTVFVSKNTHDTGKTIWFEKEDMPELRKIATDYANAIFGEGGYGPITVQFRKDKHGHWKAQEINMRTNGNTFPRFLMGQDDIGQIFNYSCPNMEFPVYASNPDNEGLVIGKTLNSYAINRSALIELTELRVWSKEKN